MIDSLVLRLCDALPDLVFLLDRSWTVQVANRRIARLVGLPVGQIIGRPLLDLAAGEPEPIRTYLARCAGSGSPLPGALPLRTPSGTAALQARGSALRTDGATMILLRCVERPKASQLFVELNAKLARLGDELHRRRRLQEELQRALVEREVLLKEVHHRVRNNLQIITSFINLQLGELPSETTRQVLREVQARIRVLGLIHGQLYAERHVGEIDLADLVPALCAQLAALYVVASERVQFDVALPSWSIDLRPAVPVALLITEAVTNALKHAFPADRSGTVRIALEWRDDARILSIADDGVGWPDAERALANGSPGVRLMRAFAEQVEGRLEVQVDPGVEVRLTLPHGSLSR